MVSPVMHYSKLQSKQISEEQRLCLERLLASEIITRAPRLRSLLSFLVDALLQDETDKINEQCLGETVFGRSAGYNPADDNIVRVSIRHLRKRLEKFYRTEGREEPYRLEIPLGKYVPMLVPQSQPAPEEEPSDDKALLPVAEGIPVVKQATASPRRAFIEKLALAIAILSLAGNAVFAYLQFHSHVDAAATAQPGLLQLILQRGNSATVVVTDSDLQAYREIFRRQVSLANYINRSYLQRDIAPASPVEAGAQRYVAQAMDTSLTSVIVGAEIQESALPGKVTIKHPHDMSLRDFQESNLILLGGPWINPWGQLFEDRLNFRLLPRSGDPASSEIENVNPHAGEPALFAPQNVGNLTLNYARIAMLPNLNNSGRVVLLGATSLGALEAGGNFLVATDSLGSLLRRFQVRTPQQLPFFEIVLEVKGMGSVPGAVQIIAQRTVEASHTR